MDHMLFEQQHSCTSEPRPGPAILTEESEQVVDTTGAGDCFTGAFAVAFLEGSGFQEAMRFASAIFSSWSLVLSLKLPKTLHLLNFFTLLPLFVLNVFTRLYSYTLYGTILLL